MNKYIKKLEENKDKLLKLKEELSKKQHKVQLTLVDDLQNSIGEAESIINQGSEDRIELENLISDYESIGDRIQQAYDNVETTVKDMEQVQDIINADMQSLEKSAKELGIDLNDIPGYRKAEIMFDQLDFGIEELDNTLSKVPKDLT
tara:strand:- start:784 stop:1224 length:441 start_codon:yes stop_codon:yes gene_type:complete